MTSSELTALKNILYEFNALDSSLTVLAWDQETIMPEMGADARAGQIGTLERLAHERFTSDELGELVYGLKDSEELGEADRALVRYVFQKFERERRIPSTLKGELLEHGSRTYPVWAQAREEDNFDLVRPHLERMLELSQAVAACFPEHEHPMDAMVDESDPGMLAKDIQVIFRQLREGLVPLVADIAGAQPPATDFLHREYPEADQAAFGMKVIRALGFDPARNRQDKTHHPFMTRISAGDIRITTRYKANDFGEGFFSSLHETGHGLYEMGVDPALDGLPIGEGVSAGFHESQSRLWENMIGRSRPFWEHFYPQAQAAFTAQLGGVGLADFHRAINVVRPSLIRTDADEVTYNLHIMIRFDLEMAMLEGSLAVADLPEAWRARYQSDLGVCSETDADGVLQDVHWYSGQIGGEFQGYALGNILGAQIFEAAQAALPDLWDQVRRGNFRPLHNWLVENVYRHGSMYTPAELLARITGSAIDAGPLLRYLETKYRGLYGV